VATPLREPRLQPKPKRVHLKELHVAVRLTDEQKQDFADLVEHIPNGTRVPERFYRNDIDTSPDELLERDGIMHLHLGGPYSRELVFLVQYDEDVMILEINDHYHFKTDPIGTVLRTWHERKIRAFEEARAKEQAERAAQQRAKVRDSLRKSGLTPRDPSSDANGPT
jgi:hypothetical protein